MDRCDIQSPLNPGVVAVVIVIVGSFDAWGSVQHGREEDGGAQEQAETEGRHAIFGKRTRTAH